MRDGVDVPGNALRLIVFDQVPRVRIFSIRLASTLWRQLHGCADPLKAEAGLRTPCAPGRRAGVFVLLDPMMPTRLLGAFPQGVDVRRCGLAEAVAETQAFSGRHCVPMPSVDVDEVPF